MSSQRSIHGEGEQDESQPQQRDRHLEPEPVRAEVTSSGKEKPSETHHERCFHLLCQSVERTHRLGTRTRAPSVDAGVYTAAAEPAGMCRIHLSGPGDSAATSNTGFPEEIHESNARLRSDEKPPSHLDHSN